MNECGLEWGCHRLVIVLDKVVFKFPNFLYSFEWFVKGLKGNKQEAGLSGTNERLCPVVFCLPLGLLLVMKKAQKLEGSQFDFLSLGKFMKKYNITTAEEKFESFGLLQNKVVCIDYENQ